MLHATRPRYFFRPTGPMPAAVTLHLALPHELGDPEQLLAELRERVAAAEAALAAERMRTGGRVLGRRMILRLSPTSAFTPPSGDNYPGTWGSVPWVPRISGPRRRGVVQ